MEELAKHITMTVSHAVEILAAVIIGIAIIKVLARYIMHLDGNRIAKRYFLEKYSGRPEKIRVEFGSSVAIALELLLGADVLATAIAPSWDDIGKLAAIAVLRTSLNYFLGKELKEIKAVDNA